MTDLDPTEPKWYPDKPILEKDANPLVRSISSLVLFVAAFYIFFNKDLSYIFIVVVVLFIHEMGHFLAMKFFNYKEVKMFFLPLLGALVTGEKQQISQRQRAIILLAGPVPGIAIGLVLFFIGTFTGNPTQLVTANIFIFLNLFNLLPITPLDGGNLIGTLFFGSKEVLQSIFMGLSALALAAIAVYLESYFLLLIPIFLFMQAFHQHKIKKIRAVLDAENLSYEKPYDELSNEEYWRIREQIVTHVSLFKDVKPKEYVIDKRENQIIKQIKLLAVTRPSLDLSWKGKVLVLGVWLLFLVGPIVGLGLLYRMNASLVSPQQDSYTIEEEQSDLSLQEGTTLKNYE